MPDLSGSYKSLGIVKKSGSFSFKLSGLLPVTRYYSRSYAKNNFNTFYGTQREFETLDLTLPEVITSEISNITSNSAQAGSNVTNDGNGIVSDRGTCWNTSGNPSLTNCINKTQDGTGTGSFISHISSLQRVTTYYLISYATNEKGTAYGNEQLFTSNPDLPIVTTTPLSIITQTTATCGGNISSDGGATVTARGVCWSTSPTPTLANSHNIEGSGTGLFESNLSTLSANTQFYIRAYATNSSGTGYGNEVNFTTLSFSIGQNYGGGIIFYIDGTGQHGLISATSDVSGGEWGCAGTSIPGTSTAIGAGQSNTTAILSLCSETDIATKICNEMVLNGYDDWFLPSKDELNQMYLQKNVIGGFAAYSAYWSSSEYNYDFAWGLDITTGLQHYYYKSYSPMDFTRAIRSF